MAAPTVPAFQARQMHNIVAVFDAAGANVDHGAAMQSIQFVPAVNTSAVIGGKPTATFTDVSPATWTCVIKLLQDIEKTASLLNYLFANAGTSKTLTVTPHAGMTITATVILVPPALLGDANDWEVSTVTLGLTGAPVLAGQS